MSAGAIPNKRRRFAAWVRMAPTTHMCVYELHCVYCSTPLLQLGDHMAIVWSSWQRRSWGSLARPLAHKGCSVPWTRTMGAHM